MLRLSAPALLKAAATWARSSFASPRDAARPVLLKVGFGQVFGLQPDFDRNRSHEAPAPIA